MKGFIKLPRCFLEWEWWNRQPHHPLFEWLLIRAYVVDRKVEGILVRRGSLLTTWNEMQQAVGCSRGTLSRALSDLSESGEIILRTDCKKTLVTICHYEDYNGNNDTLWTDSGLQTDCQRTDTPLYKGEYKNEKDIYSACVQSSVDDGFASDYESRLWMQRYNRIAASFGAPAAEQLNTKRRLLIQQRVRERGRGSVDLLFQKLEQSALFFNQNSNGFRGDFTNLWTADTYTKVCEGYYIPSAKAEKPEEKRKPYVIDIPLRTSEEVEAERNAERKKTLLEMVRFTKDTPYWRKTVWADVLIEAYESGELASYGIEWKPE